VTDRAAASTATVAWTALLLVAVLAPLGFPVQGLPAALKGDEPGYYLLALSLWHDRDARVEEDRDLRRLFFEFPERTHNLWLVSPDGFETAYFGVPFLYPLLAAPVAGLAGARGMIALNGALFVALLWMGWRYLTRFNSEARAALYASVFFVLSHIASGLRVVLIAHGVDRRNADRLWMICVAMSIVAAAAIIAGMCGVRIGALAS